MLNSKKLPIKLQGETVNNACYILNRVLENNTSKTPYEIWKERKSNLKYFHTFGSNCFVLNDSEYLGKFDYRSDERDSLVIQKIIEPQTQTIIESI